MFLTEGSVVNSLTASRATRARTFNESSEDGADTGLTAQSAFSLKAFT
jgi:hypothetical protein